MLDELLNHGGVCRNVGVFFVVERFKISPLLLDDGGVALKKIAFPKSKRGKKRSGFQERFAYLLDWDPKALT